MVEIKIRSGVIQMKLQRRCLRWRAVVSTEFPSDIITKESDWYFRRKDAERELKWLAFEAGGFLWQLYAANLMPIPPEIQDAIDMTKVEDLFA